MTSWFLAIKAWAVILSERSERRIYVFSCSTHAPTREHKMHRSLAPRRGHRGKESKQSPALFSSASSVPSVVKRYKLHVPQCRKRVMSFRKVVNYKLLLRQPVLKMLLDAVEQVHARGRARNAVSLAGIEL